MKVKSPKNAWAGLLFIAFGVAAIAIARHNYEFGSSVNMGPGYFPTVLGGLLTVLGIVIACSSVVVEGPRVARFHFRPLLLVLLACVAFGYLLKPAGLVVATMAMVFISSFGGHEFRWKEVSALAVVMALFSALVFGKVLHLPLPLLPPILG